MSDLSIPKGIREMQRLLQDIAKEVKDTTTRKEVLEAMAEPVVEEAKRRVAPGGGVFEGQGNLAKNITSQWTPTNPSEIDIGYTAKGYYGIFWERGFFHYAKGSTGRHFLKKPHLRPAYTAKKREIGELGIKMLKEHLERIE